VQPLQFQAWVGLASTPPLVLLTVSLESGQLAQASQAGWALVAAVLFSAVVVSLLGHTVFYGLLLKHPANLIAPLMVMNPLMTVALGLTITGDPFDARIALGGTIALAGVLLLTLSPFHMARALAWLGIRRH